jgi:hypothetical protein
MWLDLAKLQYHSGKRRASFASFDQAARLDPRQLQERIPRDQALYELYIDWYKQTQQGRQCPRAWQN